MDLPYAYNDFYKVNAESDFRTFTDGPSLTRQEFATECDINEIMARYETTGQLPVNNASGPVYVDYTDMPEDLMGTMKLVQDAAASFMTLPAKVRRFFDNDPLLFTEFASDPVNVDQMREWGLAKPQEAPQAVPEPPAPAPAPAPAPGAGASPEPS